MSSIIGHALVGIGISYIPRQLTKPPRLKLWWPAWLVGVAVAHDLDYVVPPLNPAAHHGLRITHSLFGCCLLPLLTGLVLCFINLSAQEKRAKQLQVLLAGLSHLVMDLLVGVTSLPIAWPLSHISYKLPFGVLPSAPAFQLHNVYMYRNLLLELAILGPLLVGSHLRWHTPQSKQRGWLWSVLGIVFALGLIWGYNLER